KKRDRGSGQATTRRQELPQQEWQPSRRRSIRLAPREQGGCRSRAVAIAREIRSLRISPLSRQPLQRAHRGEPSRHQSFTQSVSPSTATTKTNRAVEPSQRTTRAPVRYMGGHSCTPARSTGDTHVAPRQRASDAPEASPRCASENT